MNIKRTCEKIMVAGVLFGLVALCVGALAGLLTNLLAVTHVNLVAPRSEVRCDVPGHPVPLACLPAGERDALSRTGVMMDDDPLQQPIGVEGGSGTGTGVKKCEPAACSITCTDGTSCSAAAPVGSGKYAVCTCSEQIGAYCVTRFC